MESSDETTSVPLLHPPPASRPWHAPPLGVAVEARIAAPPRAAAAPVASAPPSAADTLYHQFSSVQRGGPLPTSKAAETRFKVLQRAAKLGLHHMGGEHAFNWRSTPTEGEQNFAEYLLASARERAARKLDVSKLSASLNFFIKFKEAMPSREPFIAPRGFHDWEAARHNEDTRIMFAEFMREHGSVRKGCESNILRAKTIRAYVGAIMGFMEFELGCKLLASDQDVTWKYMMREMQFDDGPASDRKRRVGLTAKHVRDLAEDPSWNRSSWWGVMRWAIILVGRNLCLRGCEFGVVDGKEFSPKHDITWESIIFKEACESSDGYEWVIVGVVPCKDVHGTRKRYPMIIRRMGKPGTPFNPLCAYDALKAAYDMQADDVSLEERATTAFFAHVDGRVVSSSDVCVICRAAAMHLSMKPLDFGAPSLRIGGAEDYYDLYGSGAQNFIKERGRWNSDIAFIYSRPSAKRHAAYSAELASASGLNLEVLIDGFSQPAFRISTIAPAGWWSSPLPRGG